MAKPRRTGKPGGQKRNRNARMYEEPLTKLVAFRVSEGMKKEFDEQIAARTLDISEVLRTYYCNYGGYKI
jgi:hypothetical protein